MVTFSSDAAVRPHFPFECSLFYVLDATECWQMGDGTFCKHTSVAFDLNNLVCRNNPEYHPFSNSAQFDQTHFDCLLDSYFIGNKIMCLYKKVYA